MQSPVPAGSAITLKLSGGFARCSAWTNQHSSKHPVWIGNVSANQAWKRLAIWRTPRQGFWVWRAASVVLPTCIGLLLNAAVVEPRNSVFLPPTVSLWESLRCGSLTAWKKHPQVLTGFSPAYPEGYRPLQMKRSSQHQRADSGLTVGGGHWQDVEFGDCMHLSSWRGTVTKLRVSIGLVKLCFVRGCYAYQYRCLWPIKKRFGKHGTHQFSNFIYWFLSTV